MPRIREDIKHISQRDIDAFTMLWNTHHAPRELLDISDNRLKTYEHQGLIDRCRSLDGKEVIRCTEKGRQYIGKLPEFAGRRPYSSPTATTHNCELAEIFKRLSPEQRENYRTEQEVADMYKEQMEHLREHDHDRWEQLREREWSPPDGAIVSDSGIEQMIEIVTENYSGSDLEIKLVCSEVLNAPIEFYRV